MSAPTDRTGFAGSAGLQADAQLARRWAQEVLGLAPAHDPRALRAAALTRLADDEFILWPQAHVAVTLLAGGELTDEDQCTLAEGVGLQLREEVEKFCGRFFEIAPQQRRSRWEQLRASCEDDPVLLHQLAALEAGLDVDPQADQQLEASARELIDVICRIFVAPPAESARRRRAAIGRFFGNPQQWSQAAETVGRTRPDIAKLLPEFLSRVHQLPWRVNRMQVGRRKRLKLQQGREVRPVATRTSEGGGWRALVLGAVIVSVLRACVSMTTSPTPVPDHRYRQDSLRALRAARQQFDRESRQDGFNQVAPDGRLFGQQFRLERRQDGGYQLVPHDPLPNAPEAADAEDQDDIWSAPDYRIRPPTPTQPTVPSLRPPPPADPYRSLAPFQQPDLRPYRIDPPPSPPAGRGGGLP